MGALTAGPFGGAFFPVFLWLWKDRKSRMMAWVGIAGLWPWSSPPTPAPRRWPLAAVFWASLSWRLRKKMSMVRRVFACTLVALHLYMKAPVWALIGRIDLTGSSSSYQRYIMVDMTIKHFKETAPLPPDYINWGWDSYDLCNQFVAVGLTGGLLTLIFYVTIFVRSFRAIGVARKAVEPDRAKKVVHVRFWIHSVCRAGCPLGH